MRKLCSCKYGLPFIEKDDSEGGARAQTLRWPSTSPIFFYLHHWVIPPPMNSIHLWNQYIGEWLCVIFKDKSWKTLQLLSGSLGLPDLRETSCHVMRTFKESYRDAHMVWNWGFLSTVMYMDHPGSGFSSFSQSCRWLQCQPTPWDYPHERF